METLELIKTSFFSLHHTGQNLYTLLSCVPDERERCFEGDTPKSETNKFKRCWRGINVKYTKKLPAVFNWNIHFRNRTQLATAAQNGTQQASMAQNGTENAASPRSRIRETDVRKIVTEKSSMT